MSLNKCKNKEEACTMGFHGLVILMFTLCFFWASGTVESVLAQEGVGEAAGGTKCISSCTQYTTEDPVSRNQGSNTFIHPQATSGSKAVFGTDELVGMSNWSSAQTHQSMATDKYGNFYLAWQDDYTGIQRIYIYWSRDGGESWRSYATIYHSGADLREPSIAVASGLYNILYVAYIVDDGVSMPYPEVATSSLPTEVFTFHSIPVWNWEGYAKPVIWTNAIKYTTNWRAYLTCEGIFSSATSNINVCFWQSGLAGGAFDDEKVLLGNADSFAWRDPDGSFGTPNCRNFLACFNDTNDTLYAMHTENFLGAWQASTAVTTMTTVPTHAVDPDIEAAVLYNNVMLCCTKSAGGNDNIGVTRSSNGGASWTSLDSLSGYTTSDEWGAELTANEGGASWHLTFTSPWKCWYSKAPQNMTTSFQAVPDRVDDSAYVSTNNIKKGIASTWDNDVVGIAWSDYRDGTDYDTYFDHVDDPSRIYVPGDYSTIQAAINASTTGQTIHVSKGTYYENIIFNGRAVHLMSAYPGGSTIDGSQLDSVVKFQSGEGSDSVIEGFLIRNGRSGGGGGIHCYGTSPHIINNFIQGNESLNYGGGIHCNTSGNPFIANNEIRFNSATNLMGGGVYCRDAEPVFMNNVITYNTAATFGGGMVCYDSDALVLNNTLAFNSADASGGGLYVKGAVTPELRNTILWDNTAPTGAQIGVHTAGPTLVHCDVQGGWPGTNTIDRDPQFYNPDCRLTLFSPCINMGTNHYSPTADKDGYIRPQNGTTDIGAFEFASDWSGYGSHVLTADRFTIEESAATVIHLDLFAETYNAYRQYFILASVSGCVPGLPLPGGNVVLPMNWDPVTDIILGMWNSPALQNFYSSLDSMGRAEAVINTQGPLPPGAVGVELSFSFGLFSPPWNHCDVASNPVILTVVP